MVDLDELILRCRDERARSYIREAVACYRAGANRAAIVATWIAVVFDFLHKLGELDLSGDKNAKKKIQEFEAIQAGGESKLKEALEFERDILKVAMDEFELFTHLEKEDLERLQKDRNRCAHPSMQSLDDPYQPTAELARTHIRNAVEILLQREPVQGKAALQRISDEVKSDYFPKTVKEAKEHFESGPLKRAREPLIRSILIGFTKAIIGSDTAPREKRKLCVAISAVCEMYRAVSEKIIRHDIKPIFESVADNQIWTIIMYFRYLPASWDLVGTAIQNTAMRYLSQVSVEFELMVSFRYAMEVPGLKNTALSRLADISDKAFSPILEDFPSSELVPRSIAIFRKSGSFRSSESNFDDFIMPMAPVLQAKHIREVLDAVIGNYEIYDAGGIPERLVKLLDATGSLRGQTTADWKAFLTEIKSRGDIVSYDDLEERMKALGM